MMGSKGRRGMKLSNGSTSKNKNKMANAEKSKIASLNQGRGQEITGVTLPAEGSVKGWEFGAGMSVACANIEGNFYAIQGACPRCAFDLYKGDIITDEAFGDLPRIACPTCATTFSFRTGTHGPALKRTGLAGFVGGLTKTATVNDSNRDAMAFMITRDESGRVFMKEK